MMSLFLFQCRQVVVPGTMILHLITYMERGGSAVEMRFNLYAPSTRFNFYAHPKNILNLLK